MVWSWLWSSSNTGIRGNERADHIAEAGTQSSPLYGGCHPGTVVRPINVHLLHPSPSRAGHALGSGTPTLRAQGQGEEVLTREPTRTHHSIGLRYQSMEGVTPPHVIDATSSTPPMPGMLLDFNSDMESPARILQF